MSVSAEEWNQYVSIMLTGPLALLRAVVPFMQQQKTRQSGCHYFIYCKKSLPGHCAFQQFAGGFGKCFKNSRGGVRPGWHF